jgi:exoribonuclease R
MPQDDLIAIGRHCSETEGNSAAAERALRTFLVLQYLAEHHLGDELPAVISGFNPGGLYVSLNRYLVDGQVTWEHMGTSKRDRWVEIEGQGRMVAKGSGAVIAIGDPITVQIVRVDPAARELDLLLQDRPDRVVGDLPRSVTKKRHEQKRKHGDKANRYKGGKRKRR